MPEPGLYPRDGCRTTDSKAERRVYDALAARLPKGWFGWHSLRIRTAEGIDGEGDFVLAIPDRGFLVLEVKGGSICIQGGRWFQNNKPMKQAPREQGNHFARELAGRLRLKGFVSPAYGVATCFPDTPFAQGPSQDDVAGCVLGEQDIAWIDKAIQNVAEKVLGHSAKPLGNWIQGLHSLWCETWTPRLSLGQRVRLQQELRVKLDATQLELLDALQANKSLLVEGGAGTGKTLLAREAALRFAAAGGQVLLLCYTEPLAKWLSEQTVAPNLKVRAVKRFAVELLAEAGLAPAPEDSESYWRAVSWRAVSEALPLLKKRFDAIVIDEAQDMAEDDWLLAETLSQDGTLWAFGDPEQAFWADRGVRDKPFTAKFRLNKRYRCPEAINALAEAYQGKPINVGLLQNAHDQGIIGTVVCPSASSIADKIALELDRLRAQGLAAKDIAILSLRGAAPPDSIVYQEKLGAFKLVRADDPALDSNVVVETFLRFKGLERPAVIVTDLHLASDRPDLAKRIYIALTRALVLVRVAATRENFERDPVLKTLSSQ